MEAPQVSEFSVISFELGSKKYEFKFDPNHPEEAVVYSSGEKLGEVKALRNAIQVFVDRHPLSFTE